MVMGLLPPLVQIRENPEFHDLIQRDKRPGQGACFGMVGFLLWMVLVAGLLVLGGSLLMFLSLDWEDTRHTDLNIELVWRILSLELVLATWLIILTFGRTVALCVMRSRMYTAVGLGFLQLLLGPVGFIAHGGIWISCRLMLILEMSNVGFTFRFPSRCRPFKETSFFFGEGGLVVALQAARPIHLGVDNANVVGHVGRTIAKKDPMRPFELLIDGDLLSLVKMPVWA